MSCRQLVRVRRLIDRCGVHEIRHDRYLSQEIEPTRRGGSQNEALIGHDSRSGGQHGSCNRRTREPKVSAPAAYNFLLNTIIRNGTGRDTAAPLLSTIGAMPDWVKLNDDSLSSVKTLKVPGRAEREALENALSQMIAHHAVSVEHFLAVPLDRRRVEHGPKFDVARHRTREFHGAVLRFRG